MKARRVEFHPHFSEDFAAAVEYFIAEVPHRVEELLADYERKLDELIEEPGIYAVRNDDGLRRANLDTFSYSIRYDWTGDTLSIVTFAHHHQDTARWIHRLVAMKRR